jgi:hypothetical protein
MPQCTLSKIIIKKLYSLISSPSLPPSPPPSPHTLTHMHTADLENHKILLFSTKYGNLTDLGFKNIAVKHETKLN